MSRTLRATRPRGSSRISRRSSSGSILASRRTISSRATPRTTFGVRLPFFDETGYSSSAEMGATGPCGPCRSVPSFRVYKYTHLVQRDPLRPHRRTERREPRQPRRPRRPRDMEQRLHPVQPRGRWFPPPAAFEARRHRPRLRAPRLRHPGLPLKLRHGRLPANL